MTKEELIKKLIEADDGDNESSHIQADKLLIEFINDPDIAEAYNAIDKWYA